MADWIDVEVAAGDARKQALVALTLTVGATAADAVRAAGLAERLPGLVVDEGSLGVFGKRCRPDQVLENGDRVEVYQPLKADPKLVRRELAELERSKKKTKAG